MKQFCAAAFLLAISSPAFAGQCPSLWAQLDAKLQTARLTDAEKAEVTEHRQRGEALHTSGQHAESEAALNAGLALIH